MIKRTPFHYLVPGLSAIILAACATQSPAPVISAESSTVPTVTPGSTPPVSSNPYDTTPYTPDTVPAHNTPSPYPVSTNNTTVSGSTPVYTPPAANIPYIPPIQTGYVGNYAPVDTNATFHRVVSGDTVFNIAKRYGISQDQLRTWNNLSDNTIGIGQNLRVKPQGAGSSSAKPNTNTNNTTTAATPSNNRHRVVAGDTVYNIAQRYGISQEQLRSLNGLTGNDIRIGQVLRVGHHGATATAAPVSTTPTVSPYAPYVPPAASVPVATSTTVTTTPIAPITAAVPNTFEGIQWQTPLVGSKITQAFNTTGRNVKLTGSSNQNVLAAADGQVIYSGQGPRGYGNLVVVQHTPTYITVYGHNQSIAVHEKQHVKRGQHLGNVGSNGTLLFEVRENGKVIDPKPFILL